MLTVTVALAFIIDIGRKRAGSQYPTATGKLLRGTYRLVARHTMDNTRWNRDQTRRVKDRRCSVDLTWLAISQAGVNDFIRRQYLHRTDDQPGLRGIALLRGQ